MLEVLNHWLFFPEMWLIAGIILIIAEMLIDAAYFLLALGISAIIMSVLLYLQETGLYIFLDDWADLSILYGVLSIVTILIMKRFLQDRVRKSDINKY